MFHHEESTRRHSETGYTNGFRGDSKLSVAVAVRTLCVFHDLPGIHSFQKKKMFSGGRYKTEKESNWDAIGYQEWYRDGVK